MRTKTGAMPVPDRSAKLKPVDFSDVLLAVPGDCVLIGGQAVAWWAERYSIKAMVRGREREVTSRDIDFWGTHEDLFHIASRMKRTPILPNRHEMTLLVGAIELEAAGKRTSLEVLHAVPGLDSNNPVTAAVLEQVSVATRKSKLLVMSPVSLVLAKLHALRHFSQEDRQDLVHLRVCLEASKAFIRQTLKQNTRMALWNCNRLIDAYRQRPNRKMEQKHGFRILGAVPIDSIRTEAERGSQEDRDRLQKFLRIQWLRVTSSQQN
jgi:hypothetical protein